MKTFQGQPLIPLTYGQVKANKGTIDALTAPGQDSIQRTESAVEFLKISEPDADFDTATPGAIQKAALELYEATFARPEDPAPVQESPLTGVNSLA